MNFYEELEKIYTAVSLLKNECGREIDNKILLENVIFTAFYDCNGSFIHMQVQNLRASHFFFEITVVTISRIYCSYYPFFPSADSSSSPDLVH